MKKLYALSGVSESGKSESLKMLLKLLLAKYPTATVEYFYRQGQDVAVILRQVHGLVVGLESQGDPGSRLERSLTKFAEAGCDIIFCPCRTRGTTVDWVNTQASSYSIQFVSKTRVAKNRASIKAYAAANEADAASLLRMAEL